MSELAQRSITGSLYVGITVLAAVAGPVTTSLLFLPVCLLGAGELHHLLTRPGHPPGVSVFNLLVIAVAYIAVAWSGIVEYDRAPWLAAAMLVLLILASVVRALTLPLGDLPANLGKPVVGIVVWALPLALIPTLMQLGGAALFLGFLIMLWSNDTGAYLAGKSIGRTPLLPAVSPKKTVEGLVGGVVVTLAVGGVLSHFWEVMELHEWLICGAVVSLFATVGDLLESAAKRMAGLKDSGRILPGHGGILDRFDGFTLALPAMLIAARLML